MKISYIVGIDQTGAVDSKGKPKRLSVAILKLQKNGFVAQTNLTLNRLQLAEIKDLIKNYFPSFQNERVLICVDSVLGLPKLCKTPIRKLLTKARTFDHNGKAFGAQTAYQFYQSFVANPPYPQRVAESKVNANSVFLLRPYQRNIGCGSFRTLKDLSIDSSWFSIWPFESADKQFILAEGYPSYFWKTNLRLATRDIHQLRKRYPKQEFKNLDFADAFVLALGARDNLAYINDTSIYPTAITNYEGWILGVPYVE